MKSVSICCFIYFLSMGCHAATDGVMGTTSSGSINITLTILPSIAIKNLDDIHLEVARNSDTDIAEIESFSVCSRLIHDYKISASSSNGKGFVLTGEEGDEITYEVLYKPFNNPQFTALTPNQRSDKYTIQANAKNCQDNNSELKIVVPSKEVNASLEDQYAGRLSLLLEVI